MIKTQYAGRLKYTVLFNKKRKKSLSIFTYSFYKF